jgi:hypothetical protein
MNCTHHTNSIHPRYSIFYSNTNTAINNCGYPIIKLFLVYTGYSPKEWPLATGSQGSWASSRWTGMHLATGPLEEWPLTMDISNSSNMEHPGWNTGQTWSNIYSSHDIHTQCTIINILISQGPNGYSLLEEWPITMDLSNSNNEEHPGRYNRSNLNNIFSKQGFLYTRHSSKYPCSGYTVHIEQR